MNNDQKFIPPTAEQTAGGQIWARMEKDGKPFEPARAYEMFLLYCNLGAARSFREIVKNKLVEIDKRTLERYSAKFDWQRRTFAFDRYIAVLEQNARDIARFREQSKWVERREEVRTTEWTVGAKLIERAEIWLADATVKGTPNDVVRFFDLANRLQRNAVDAETDRITITTPEQVRQSDVLKARAALARSAELFPDMPERMRAESLALSFSVTVGEILAPEEILSSIVAENVSKAIN